MAVEPLEEKAHRKPYSDLPVLTEKMGRDFLIREHSDKMRSWQFQSERVDVD